MASSTIGTNIVPDEQQFIQSIEKLFSVVEEAYLKDDENHKRIMLMNKLRDHINMGGKIAYNLVPADFRDKVIQSLEDQNIPYMAAPDGKGNVMVVVRDKDKDKLLEIQQDFEFLSTDYIKELTPQNMLMLYKAHGIKDVDSLTFNNREMAEVAKQKLYQAGVTFAELQKEDEVELIISPMSKFGRKGDDLAYFELYHSFEQSKADKMFAGGKMQGNCTEFLQTRFMQASYDKEQLTKFAQRVVNGQTGVLCSSKGSQNVCIECNQMGVFVLTRSETSSDGKYSWKSTKLDIGEDASVKDVEALLSKYADRVRDMTITTRDNFDHFKDLVLSGNEVFLQGCSKRPKNNAVSKTAEGFCSVASYDIDPMLKAINKEATRRTLAKIGDKIVPQNTAYQMKKEAIENILHAKDLPEIQEFLNGNDKKMPHAQRAEWYSNIVDHFSNTHEDTEYSCDVIKTKFKDIVNRVSKYSNYENVMQKEEEKKQKEEDEKEASSGFEKDFSADE